MKEGTLVNTQVKKSMLVPTGNAHSSGNLNTNDYYLELVEGFENLKHEESEVYNTDYGIEISQDELNNRILNETHDEGLRDFCM
jgi:hypothetical protein